jgi:uncharacterized protein YcnI
MRISLLLAVLTVSLTTVAAAEAHVTVHPNRLPAGTFTTIVVNVPNERANAETTKVDVQLPPGFTFVSTAPVPGWTAKVITRKLAKPATVEGEKHTTEVGEVIWSGGKIGPGEFTQFPLSVSTPDTPGATITFKALQTYSNGEVVRWIGDPGADTPAPQVALTAGDASIEDVPAGATVAAASAGNSNDTRASVALALGIAGLTAGLLALALVAARRPSRR